MSRQRGYLLTIDGTKKLENAISENKISQEQLGFKAGLDRGTVCKALQREKPINFRTIRRLFISLNIPLNQGDYCGVSTSTRDKVPMGDNQKDRKLAEKAVKNAEKLAEKAKTQEERDAYLAEAQEWRERLETLPD